MFGSLGAPELLIIGVILILLFGVGKVSGLGRELGSSIKEFRRAVKDEDKEAAQQQAQVQAAPAPPAVPQYTPPAAAAPPPAAPAQTPGDQKTPSVF